MTIGIGQTLEQMWGQRLRQRRKDLRFSQRALAELVEVHQTTISKIEAGERVPTDGLKLKLARALGYGDRVHRLFPWPGQEDAA